MPTSRYRGSRRDPSTLRPREVRIQNDYPFVVYPFLKEKIYISLFFSLSLFSFSLLSHLCMYMYIYIKSLYMYISYIYNLSLSVHIYLYVYVCNLRTQSSWSVLLFVACYTVYMHITKIQAERKKIFIIYIYIYTRKKKGIDLCYINVKTNPPEKNKERKRHTCIYINV